MKLNGIVVRVSDYDTTSLQFNFMLGKIHSAFHFFRVIKIEYQACLETNTVSPAFGYPSDWNIYCIVQGPASRKQDWAL